MLEFGDCWVAELGILAALVGFRALGFGFRV